jgi:hypothetical protein
MAHYPDRTQNPDSVNNLDRVHTPIGTPSNSKVENNKNNDDKTFTKCNSTIQIPQVTPYHEDLRTLPKTGVKNPTPNSVKSTNPNFFKKLNLKNRNKNEKNFLLEIIYDTKDTNLGYKIINMKYEKIEIKNNLNTNFTENDLKRLFHLNNDENCATRFENCGLLVMPSTRLFWGWLLCSDVFDNDRNPYGDQDTGEREKSDYNDKNIENNYEILLENLKNNERFEDKNCGNYDDKNIHDVDDMKNNEFASNNGRNTENLEIFSESYKIDYDR